MQMNRRRLIMAGAAGALSISAGKALWCGNAALIAGHARTVPVVNDPVLPVEADVVIVGGGIMGASAAVCLVERGLSVVLCEKGVIGGEASGRAAGWVDSLYADPALADLISRSKVLWGEMDGRINGKTGYQKSGLTILCKDEDELQAAYEWMDLVAEHPGFDAFVISPDKASRLTGMEPDKIAGALFQPSDGMLEPRIAASAITEGARQSGLSVHQRCAVRTIELEAGHVSSVVTELGTIKTRQVVLAGGAWTPLFCANLGLKLPQLQAFASSISVRPRSKGPAIAGQYDRVFWRNESGGSYTIGVYDAIAPITREAIYYGIRFIPALREMWGVIRPVAGPETLRSFKVPTRWSPDDITPFEKTRILQPSFDGSAIFTAYERLQHELPVFEASDIEETWAGVLVTTPDNFPVISPVASVPGLIICSGFFNGFSIIPAAAELVADFLTGKEPKFNVQSYRYERLAA